MMQSDSHSNYYVRLTKANSDENSGYGVQYTSFGLVGKFDGFFFDKHLKTTMNFLGNFSKTKSVLIKMLLGDDKKKRKELSMAALSALFVPLSITFN